MADTTKSLWSRIMEGGSDNLLNIGGEKRTCPYDRKSCTTSIKDENVKHESNNKSSTAQCHPGCPEPKRPLQPEEFCPDIGKPKPPECCFIRMQDPCAPCCCPPKPKCEDECRPRPKRDPICGCDLCKKKQCPDGKCCGPKEPSCHKVAARKCNSESQTAAECFIAPPEMREYEIISRPRLPCKEPPPPCRCGRNTTSLFDQLIKRPLDWFLCTPLKIPIPHFEWRDIGGPERKEESCSSTSSAMHSCERKCCQPSFSPSLDSCPRPRSCDPCGSKKEANPLEKSHSEFPHCGENTEGCKYFKENSGCDCSPCRVRRILEGPLINGKEAPEAANHEKNNSHLRIYCDCGPCRVRRTLEKPICS